MQKFGKRPNASDFATILQSGKPPLPCRIVERTQRVVRISLSDPANIARSFTLIFNNAREQVFCQTISIGENCVMARYASQESANREIGLTSVVASLVEAERWRGVA